MSRFMSVWEIPSDIVSMVHDNQPLFREVKRSGKRAHWLRIIDRQIQLYCLKS